MTHKVVITTVISDELYRECKKRDIKWHYALELGVRKLISADDDGERSEASKQELLTNIDKMQKRLSQVVQENYSLQLQINNLFKESGKNEN